MALLEGTFLVHTLPPWYRNIGKRLVKSPNVLLCDTGLGASLLGMDVRRMIKTLAVEQDACVQAFPVISVFFLRARAKSPCVMDEQMNSEAWWR
jgi:hypothetical protein